MSTVASFSNSHKGVLWVSGHTGEASLKYKDVLKRGDWVGFRIKMVYQKVNMGFGILIDRVWRGP